MKFEEVYMDAHFPDLGNNKDRRKARINRKHKEKDAWHEQRKARDFA